MTNERLVVIAKYLAIFCFLVLLSLTYGNRAGVVRLNEIRSSGDAALSAYDLAHSDEIYDQKTEAYNVAIEFYDLQLDFYRRKMEEFRSDPDAFMASNQGSYNRPYPSPPYKPSKPLDLEVQRQLQDISLEFRQERHRYFSRLAQYNMISATAAILLGLSLLYLTMFDDSKGRLFYVAILVVALVFFIGPAFHSVLTGIVGGMRPPYSGVNSYRPYGY